MFHVKPTRVAPKSRGTVLEFGPESWAACSCPLGSGRPELCPPSRWPLQLRSSGEEWPLGRQTDSPRVTVGAKPSLTKLLECHRLDQGGTRFESKLG
jgi:hypothetical protein